MENEVKQRNQRNRRRERAQRMQAQRESKVKDGDSGEDESPAREKPPRPPARRKKSREPLGEEDIIDGFAIMAFRTYEDLEAAVKCASSPRTNSLSALSTKPRQPLAALAADTTRNHPPNNVNSHGITLLQDAGTSDDSGRASERLTGSSVAPRDPDSSRDRLSDASSRCSSGKGYICDSEGDDDKASPENSRNASPRYHDVSMDDASDAGSLFRVTAPAAGGGGGKHELVARGGSGGALALSRAPVGGSASPAPAPLPQPAPSPAPAALPPPALPPPPFRADTPHRPSSAHIPALDGHAATATATQIPARPVGAAGPDTPERPASNNKLQPGARAAADSPTPAPPAPPAPSPLFPSHTAYQSQSHAAAALPDYRHTNHETRTEPPEKPPAPLDLHAHHTPRPPHPPHQPHLAPSAAQASHASLSTRVPHSQPHPVMPGHDVRNVQAAPQTLSSVPTSFPNRISGVSSSVAPHSTPSSNSSCLPSQNLPGRPISPAAPSSRPFTAPSIGSSHVNSSISSGIHSHPIPYQSQSSLQKHSVQSVYASRPSHLAPFSVSNHISLNHNMSPTTASQPMATHTTHPINSHSITNHAHHLPMNNSNLLPIPTPNHIGPPATLSPATASSISSYPSTLKHPVLGLQPHPGPITPTVSAHQIINHVDSLPISSASAIVTSTSTTSAHPLAPPVVDSRQAALPSSDLPAKTESPVINAGLTSNGYPPPAVYSGGNYPPLYAPYATTLQHSPYLPPSAASPRNTETRTSLSASPLVAPKTPKGVRPHTPGSSGAAAAALAYSPRGLSPTRERESFSNISSLSRSTASAGAAPSLAAPLAAPLPAPLAPLPGPLGLGGGLMGLGGGLSGLPAPAATLGAGLASSSGTLSSGLGPGLSAPSGALGPGLAATGGLGAGLAAPTATPAAPGPLLPHSLAPVPTVPSISSGAKPPAHWGVTRPTGADRTSSFAPAPPLFGAPLAPPNPNPFSAESLFQTSPGADLLRRELDNRFLAAAGVRTEMHHHQHQHTHVHQHGHHAHPQHAPHPPPPHHQLLVPHSPLFKDVGKMPPLYRSGLGLGYGYAPSLLHPAAPYVPAAPLSTYAPKPVVSAASDSAPKPPPRPALAKTGKWNAMHVRIAWEIYNHQQKEKSSGGPVNPSSADKDKLRAFPAAAPPPAAYRSPYELGGAAYLAHHPHLAAVRYEERGARAVPPYARYPPAYPPAGAFPLPAYGLHAPLLHDWRARGPAERREMEERERARRERDERERRERDERERRKARDLERARTRSPLRNGVPDAVKDERKEPPRHAPPMAAYPPPPWDPYRAFDPLHHMRFAPFVEAAIRAEEDRAKMLNAYAHHQQLKASPLMHRPLPPHAPLGPPLAPLAPLDLLKKEEPR